MEWFDIIKGVLIIANLYLIGILIIKFFEKKQGQDLIKK